MNPHESTLSKMIEILEMLEKNKLPEGDVPPEMQEILSKLNEEIFKLQEINKKLLESANLDEKNLRIEAMHSPHATDKQKRFLERAKNFTNDVKSLHKAATKAAKKRSPPGGNAESKQQSKERRKRFKPLGGDKDWIPM